MTNTACSPLSGAQWSTLFISQEHCDQHYSHLRSTVISTVCISGTQWSTLFSCLRHTIINSNNMVHMSQEHNDLCCSHVRNTMINIVHMPQEHWNTRHSLQMKEPWCLLPEILDLSLKWVWQFSKVLFNCSTLLPRGKLIAKGMCHVPSTTIYTFMPVITG